MTFFKYLFLVFNIIFLTACDDEIKEPAVAEPTEVGVVVLKLSPVTLTSDLTGRTTATLSADVRPQVGGIIQKRLFTEGQDVEEGQILYLIDPSRYQAAYDEAAAALKNAQTIVSAAKLKAQRYAILEKEQGVSREEYEDARATYEQNVASVAEKKAALESAKINLAWTRVTAPISGHIGISSVTPGALVTSEQTTALATIRSLDRMYVDMTQSSSQLLALRKQALQQNKDSIDNVTLTLEDGSIYPHKGTLQLSEVAVDEATGSVTLRAVFPNPGFILLPGMFVRTRVVNGTLNDAILAPQQGITRDSAGNGSALIVDKENKVEQRSVTTSRAIGDHWLVTKGLSSGDKLIVEGRSKVTTGESVKAVVISNKSEGA
ncbi:membrane fusion protein (multidrug efflux system)|uniref:Membrane fusion protein (Multidrug efflux system) n=1 Tax=Brenneria salicis ATCC 15712 = DSM 30166 TaxID=714314 RepID=A0A366I5L6_9GAMM|nr:membrane fusion protein (multidrug efflux system) [Brenneria salicis ATCC 15712 = DSM 30166]RBP61969.1 membrane fusion protein (multidrug efflux system) [Brenneria salicis ATCC 15712 = DSM 30166]RLM31228.1 efflux transporter periplasmic adaptor subunit [Brenneria salicis ATCC 15712 = DSM 30166]